MTDELDERLSHSLTDHAVRCDYIRHAEDREKNTDPDDF